MTNEVKAVIFNLEGVLCSTDKHQYKAWNILADKLDKSIDTHLEETTPSYLSEEVRKTLNELRLKGLKLAVGSSSVHTRLALQKIGLDHYFDTVLDRSLDPGKPYWQILLDIAATLNTDLSSCVTVQSSVTGAEAGHAADMTVACLGDAARAEAGNYNLTCFSELIEVVE